jgi:hypothetical protein
LRLYARAFQARAWLKPPATEPLGTLDFRTVPL